MPGFSDYAELKVLDFMFGSTQPATPTTWYLALLGTLPLDTVVDPTSAYGEMTYTGYARLAIGNNTATWSAGAAGQKKNAIALYFATCTAGSGTAVAWGICDAVTLGTVWVWGSMVTNKIISTGDVPQFAVNDIVINLD